MAEDTGGTRLKKRRKRTKKLLELQDLKSTQETQASGKSSKVKTNMYPFADEVITLKLFIVLCLS